MSQTVTEPAPQPATWRRPADLLMSLIVTLLAPMFLGVAGGDVTMARAAAAETVRDYRAQNLSDLIAIALIIAYGMAALGSLSLSMADDLSLSMTLRLRGNANACTRSAERNRCALSPNCGADPMPYDQEMAVADEPEAAPEQPDEDVFLNDAAATLLAEDSKARIQNAAEKTRGQAQPQASTAPANTTPVTEKRLREMWTIVRAKEAAELTANPPALPAAEHSTVLTRVRMLGSTADASLGQGNSPGTSFESENHRG